MAARSTIWERIDTMVDRGPSIGALQRHRLHLVAAHRLRASGRPVDPKLRQAERLAAIRAIAVPHLLERIQAAATRPVVLMKGPEAGASYPVASTRPFKDLDLLTDDAERLYADLVTAGFRPVTGSAEYHMPGLMWPGLPVAIEVHRAPHYVLGLPIPEIDELLQLTRPSRTGVAGIQGFAPAAHAVLLAVHAWAHGPLERVGHLLDVAAVSAEADPAAASTLADRWGCSRLWRTTAACIDALLLDAPAPLALRTWARHLVAVREPNVLESYVARVIGPVWALPRRRAVSGVGAELRRTAMPYEDESWTDQLRRAGHAAAHAFLPVSEQRL